MQQKKYKPKDFHFELKTVVDELSSLVSTVELDLLVIVDTRVKILTKFLIIIKLMTKYFDLTNGQNKNSSDILTFLIWYSTLTSNDLYPIFLKL